MLAHIVNKDKDKDMDLHERASLVAVACLLLMGNT